MKIAIVAKPKESAVTYYRVTPLIELCRQKNWQMALIQPKELTEDVLTYFDIAFFHRPITDAETRALWSAKKLGVKTWLDIDDLLWSIPIHNPALLHHGPDERDNLLTNLLNADIITTSTNYLAERIRQDVDRTAVVIPNAWHERTGEAKGYDTTPEQVNVLYRGSNTHDGDLYAHRAAFREYNKLQFCFMGTLPWYFTAQYGGALKTIRHENWTTTVQVYFQRLREVNPTFMIVPLEDNDFNKAKSNIAAIEATMYAGAITIYPSYLPEFAKFPGIPYDSVPHLCSVLAELDKTPPASLAHVHKAATEYVTTVLPLKDMNEARMIVVEHLTGKNTREGGVTISTRLSG